jgi:alkaline phosphatase
MGRISKAVVIVALSFVLLCPAGHAEADISAPQGDTNDLSFYRPSDTAASYPLTREEVRNVIFCIGDGMGLSQVTLARAKAAGLGGRLCLERLPVTGLVQTYSQDSCVTDSAAAATALACGVKTNNGVLGMTPDGQEYRTILEAAQARGMATGLVVTSTISHATPAGFAAHVKSRNMEAKIAEQLVANRVNVLFGGGRKFFLPRSDSHSGRKDDTDLLAAAREAGYECIETAEELRSATGPRLLGLFQLDALTTKSPEPSLAQLTEKAIQVLRRRPRSADASGRATRRGFFLMVEGSQIDWACHSNDAKGAVRQTLLFDQAVGVAVDFALRDGRTLVIVTADHETGGLTLPGAGNENKGDAKLSVRWSTKGHTGSPVPIYAMGPGALRFAGVQDNTDIPRKIAQLLDIRPFPGPGQ